MSGIKAGGAHLNHGRRLLKVKAGLKAGGIKLNHSRRLLGTK